MKNIVLLIFLSLLFLIGFLKGFYHWKALKLVRPDLVKFKTIGDFNRSINMMDPRQYWDYVEVTFQLLLPAFLFKNAYTDIKLINKVRVLSFFYLLLVAVLFLVASDTVDIRDSN